MVEIANNTTAIARNGPEKDIYSAKAAEVKPEENIDDNEEMTATDMIDELYTKPTTSVEDITKVMEDFIVV